MFFLRLLHKQVVSILLLGLACLLILSSCTSLNSSNNPQPHGTASPTPGVLFNSLPGARPFIDTWTNIHLLQSFDYNISNPAAVARHYDFVWGADADRVAATRAGNPNIFITYYIPFHREKGHVHNLTYWKSVHPDWVLYKCDKVTPAYEYEQLSMPLDFTNPAVVAWQIQTYAQPALAGGYDGIAADNLNMENDFGACGYYQHGQWVQRYSGEREDVQWRTDIVKWVTMMQEALHHLRRPLALVANLGLENVSPADTQVQQTVNHLDGVLDESGFTNFGQGYLTDNAWIQKLQFIEAVQQQHKPYYSVNQYSSTVDSNAVQWALASYLLVKEHSEYLSISQVQGYGGDNRYNEYIAQIGSPQGSMYQDQNVYWRNYSHGVSIVNSSSSNTYSVSLKAGSKYMDLYGNSVSQTITLLPHTGIILLYA